MSVPVKILILETISNRDERGFIAAPITNGQLRSIYNVDIVSLRPGSVRGNHYHQHKTEYICILGWPCKFIAIDNQDDEKMELIFNSEKCPLIVVPPGVTHALKNIGQETIYLLCYSDESFEPSNNTVSKVILE